MAGPCNSSKAARALHRAALETNCRVSSGSIRHTPITNARAARSIFDPPLRPAGRAVASSLAQLVAAFAQDVVLTPAPAQAHA
jgi:hypothetical protein